MLSTMAVDPIINIRFSAINAVKYLRIFYATKHL